MTLTRAHRFTMNRFVEFCVIIVEPIHFDQCNLCNSRTFTIDSKREKNTIPPKTHTPVQSIRCRVQFVSHLQSQFEITISILHTKFHRFHSMLELYRIPPSIDEPQTKNWRREGAQEFRRNAVRTSCEFLSRSALPLSRQRLFHCNENIALELCNVLNHCVSAEYVHISNLC